MGIQVGQYKRICATCRQPTDELPESPAVRCPACNDALCEDCVAEYGPLCKDCWMTESIVDWFKSLGGAC
jgi:hypothetical protein